MKVFVTGATGFLGSHLAEALVRRGDTVTCLVRRTSDLKWLQGLGVRFAYGDVVNPDVLAEAVRGAEVVYHVAGLLAARSEADFLKVNADGVENLIRACLEACAPLKRFVLVSSVAAMGSSASGIPLDENSPCDPRPPYGSSKREGELRALKYQQKIPLTIIRPPGIYGPRDRQILKIFKVANSGFFPLIGRRDRSVNVAHVSDVVQGILLAGDSPHAIGETFIIAGGENPTWNELMVLLSEVLGKKVRVVPLPMQLALWVADLAGLVARLTGRPAIFTREKAADFGGRQWVYSIEKAQRVLGYNPHYTVRDGFKETVTWYRREGWL